MSVIVPCFRGAEQIGDCLGSLAAQTLDHRAFEAVVVLNGPDDGSADRVAEVRAAHPTLQVRLVRCAEPGAGRARNLGIAAAAGEHVTFLDHDDRVSPGFLEALLDAATPGIVPIGLVADVIDGAEPDYDNYISQHLEPLVGELVPIVDNTRALGFSAAKLLPTAVAQSVRFAEHLRSGEDLVYWFEVTTRLTFRIAVVGREATYFRTVRPDSVSRQGESFDFLVTQRLDVMERMAEVELDETNHRALHVYETFRAAQTMHMMRYLEANPGERDAVLAEIRKRDLSHAVSWRVLNKGRGRELGILYAFMPFADTSANVAARRIRARGEMVDVISNSLGGIRRRDRSGWRIADELVARHHQVMSPATAFAWPAIVQYCDEGIVVAEQWIEEQGPYESLYSRAMLPPSHLLAALVKLRHPELHWRAEFSDPIEWNPYGERRTDEAEDDQLWQTLAAALGEAGVSVPERREVSVMVERIAYALADEILFTNQNQMEFMLGYLHDPELEARVRARSRFEHHPVPPAELYEATPREYDLSASRVNVAYFGAFYATRGLTEIVDALEALDPDERARIAFHVFTPDPDELEAGVRAKRLSDVIRVNGAVPYLAALNLTTKMDVLLVNDARTRQHYDVNPYLPSKWSDYSGSGSDVWAVVEPGSVLDGMQVRYKSVLGEPDGAVAVLREIATRAP